ncbi:hypothetical protein BOCO_0048 [Bombiscardovia coagulans]|uniref:Uncharacterized protein n=1 Tax=Bombiscardovia coagulans TaxID=686666 RepID=A0A261EVH9_9BIFI|nr:hypothetical protein BOCO_0048 [Bombiscardovia coagulans]
MSAMQASAERNTVTKRITIFLAVGANLVSSSILTSIGENEIRRLAYNKVTKKMTDYMICQFWPCGSGCLV